MLFTITGITNLTEKQAIKFAKAMGETHPHTNVNLIDAHIEWWDENYPQYAPIVKNWYERWKNDVNDEKINYKKYNESYHEFMKMLNEQELF